MLGSTDGRKLNGEGTGVRESRIGGRNPEMGAEHSERWGQAGQRGQQVRRRALSPKTKRKKRKSEEVTMWTLMQPEGKGRVDNVQMG